MTILLSSSIVTIRTASGGSFTLTTTNKGQNVKDSRTDSSRPLWDAFIEIHTLCGYLDALKACSHLLAGIMEPKAKKAAPIRENATDKEREEFAKFMKPRQLVRHPKEEEKKVEVSKMSTRQLVAYNRKQSKQAALEMEAYLTPLTIQ